MKQAEIALAAVGFAWFLFQGFGTKLLVYLAILPFVTYLEIHFPSRYWPLAPSVLLAITALSAIGVRTPLGAGERPARRYTAVVLAYAGVVAAQAFNPLLPSATVGIRGARLILEPVLLYFIGSEVARRPELLRRVLRMVAITGVIVVAYALKQAFGGFDGKELAYYVRTFPISAQEARTFGTMAGASVLGHYLALIAFLAVAQAAFGATIWPRLALAGACVVAMLLTGQRGIMLSGLMAAVLVAALVATRNDTRRFGQALLLALGVVAFLFGLLVVITPVQDRRNAGHSGKGTNAYQSARIKIALLKSGGHETSLALRVQRLEQLRDGLDAAPYGAGAGLNLLVAPGRSQTSTVLGTSGFGGPDFRPKLPPIPGELYYYTLSSELGLLGLALFIALAAGGLRSAIRVALRSPDRLHALVALAGAGFVVFVLLDSFDVDAMSSQQVASYFWLLIGLVVTWDANLGRHTRHRTAGPLPALTEPAL